MVRFYMYDIRIQPLMVDLNLDCIIFSPTINGLCI